MLQYKASADHTLNSRHKYYNTKDISQRSQIKDGPYVNAMG